MSDLDNEELEATKMLKIMEEKELDEQIKSTEKSTEETYNFLKEVPFIKYKEKSADELFAELGYTFFKTAHSISYDNLNGLSIIFSLRYKEIAVGPSINMQELQAINKKCKELRLARLGEIMEIWKDIKDYEGLYQASNVGRIRSVERYVKAKNNSKKYMKSVILKGVANDRGYYMVVLSKEGKKRKIFIHRLIAETFIKNPKNYNQVNHKDEDKTNNNVNNLEWCNCKYNCNYGTRNKRIKENRNAK